MPDDEDVAAALDSHLVGVGMWGTVYTAANGPRCYRLIPNDHLDAGGRAGLHELRARPRRPGVAPVIRHLAGDQQEIGRQWFQVVCYELAADWSLADSLASPHPIRRLTDMAVVLRAVPGWWARAAGFLPTPSDIAFTHRTPQLLVVPRWGVPSLRALFMAPERICYLAPQLLLGVRDDSGRAEDMYALAVMSLRCFARLPSWEPGELMARAACSALYSSDRCESRLPSWMRRLEAVRQALAAIDALLAHDPSARATMAPTDLADLLERCVEEMDPVATVAALRAQGRAKEAMELARTVLIDDPSYELLLLAAAIAVDELGNPLEGLELLERAVLAEPRRREALRRAVRAGARLQGGGHGPAGRGRRPLLRATPRRQRPARLRPAFPARAAGRRSRPGPLPSRQGRRAQGQQTRLHLAARRRHADVVAVRPDDRLRRDVPAPRQDQGGQGAGRQDQGRPDQDA
ncbi:hypothetical protein [Nonomuraea dietziae]|uniref:hypothetical protein n=1 Tax=Nonomuraea dietziae TaxID=65515 RepID=UPI0031DCD9E9